MSNTFNISVAPEIAALEAKVDIVDTEVDAIRATDIPGIDAKVDIVDTEVDSIRATDIPGIDTKITIIDTVVDQIRDIDVPNIQTNIDANETKIDIVDTVADAIQLKTDALPQLVRGGFTFTTGRIIGTTLTLILDLTGSGVLRFLSYNVLTAINGIKIRVLIDGVQFIDFQSTTLETQYLALLHQPTLAGDPQFIKSSDPFDLNLGFDSTLQVLTAQVVTKTEDSVVNIIYNLDDF